MGNIFSPVGECMHLAPVARTFCPFPDYNPNPLFLNVLQGNSSELSQHYTAVQASLTPQQQQDFNQTMTRTFGREGKVSNGGVGVVALSLAVLFDTVAREVKGEYVSKQEPIQGLFLKDPRGTYPAPVHTISQYLRLVPHVANNPQRMVDETERYLHQLKREFKQTMDTISTAGTIEDITTINLVRSQLVQQSMNNHLKISNKTVDLQDKFNTKDPSVVYNLNCDPKEASEKLLSALDSLGPRTKEAHEKCISYEDKTMIETIAMLDWSIVTMTSWFQKDTLDPPQVDFDLKAT